MKSDPGMNSKSQNGKSNNKCIIFGGNGFVGTHLCKVLKNSDIQFKSPTRYEVDMLDTESLQNFFININFPISTIIILAAYTPYIYSVHDDFEKMFQNVQIIKNLITVIKNVNIKEIIYLSTTDIYGYHKNLINEDTLPNPQSYYASSKLCAELLLKVFSQKHNIPLFIARSSQIYGPGDNSNKLINSLISSGLAEHELKLSTNNRQLRDYVYVEDVVNIIRNACNKGINTTINLVSGKSYSIYQVAKIIQNHLPVASKISYFTDTKTPVNYKYNNIKFVKMFKYQFISLEQGLNQTIKTKSMYE